MKEHKYGIIAVVIVVIAVGVILFGTSNETAPTDPNGTPTPTSSEGSEVPIDNEIVGVTWKWSQFQDQAGPEGDINVPNPENYTILMNSDGTFSSKVDCNQAQGSYNLDGSSLVFQFGAMTRALCPEDSLDQDFLQKMDAVRTYVVTEDGNLVLNLFADSGNMIFER